ncbi:transmembrane protein, putative (macronuclear) [Tetrahymena thermophila SB210]|uniref:Transmembrane protein, putative n=1 Tax=Tetrahymena thermophila (strain SB210) TaxID=312017 RepID=Q22S69_TETTS|nr:transmembrane protein, putative [Tetrahymena thermophila SB210]EAR87903.2 transmembrane protein, putative [Tetrahymena thermophila SB210]|eukprot:XP_001008148.2 transmembrane protein, putative [Tetrahymena thermophila SB210]
MPFSFTFLIFLIGLFKSTLQEGLVNQTRNLIEENQFRRLQSCQQYCEVCDVDGICLKCLDDRVFPNCVCQIGFYSDSQGKCQPCKQGCLTCTTANDCSAWQNIYSFDAATQGLKCNIPSTDGTCQSPNNSVLFYYTRLLNDYQTIEVIFNQMIYIKSAANFQNQIIPSPTNCAIFTADSSTFINSFSSSCSIDSLKRNIFVINLQSKPSTYNAQNLFPVPELDPTQISIQLNEKQISVTKIYKLENQMRVQNNVLNRICFFPKTEAFIKVGSSQLFLAQLIPGMIFYRNDILKEINVVSPSQYVGQKFDISNYDDPNGLSGYQISFKNTPNVEASLIISIKCSIFGSSTISQTKLSLSNTKDTNKEQVALQITGQLYFINQNLQINFQAIQFSSFQDYAIKIITQPQVMDPVVKYLAQADSNGVIGIVLPQFTVKESKEVVFVSYIYDLSGSIVYHSYCFALFASAQYITELIQPIPKQNPFSDVWITVDTKGFFLGQSQILSSDFYAQTWYCIDQNKNSCLSRTGQPFQLKQLGNRMMLPAQQMQVNMKYTFYYQFKSIGLEFSKQYQSYIVDTGSTFAIAAFSYQPLKQAINLKDVVYIVLLIQADFPYQIGNALFNLEISIGNSETKKLQSVSNQISFIPEDYFPNPDFNTPILNVKYSIYDYYFQQTIPMQDPNSPLQINLNPPNQMAINIVSKTYVAYQDQVKIQCNNCPSNIKYQFFYYTNQSDRDFELKNPLQTKRKMLSLEQQQLSTTTILPPGNLIIMILGFDVDKNLFTNVTQALTVTGTTFTEQTYTNLIQSQYAKAQLYQNQNQILNQILTYQTIMEAIEQYESSNTSPSNVTQIKLNILNNLLQGQWSTQINNILTLSGQIIQRLLQSQIQLTQQMFQSASTSIKNRISFIYSQAKVLDAASLNADTILLFQNNIQITSQIYMQLVNKSVNFGKYSESEIIQNTISLMSSYSCLLQTNQSPVRLTTQAASLQIEKYDDITFQYNYYQLVGQNLDSITLSQNYYVLTQQWTNSTYVYRDELQQINQQYLTQVNSTYVPYLQRTYDIKIPAIFTDQPYVVSSSRRRRFLQTAPPSSLRPNFIMNFGQVSPDEKLQCIQRQTTGNWVHNSCQTKVLYQNNVRSISCICQTPDVTSIIADITGLIENKNLQKIFSEDGILGLSNLTNWYEYAAIWTMIGLNVVFIMLIVHFIALDKQDFKALQSSSSQNVDSKDKPTKKQKMLLIIKQKKLESKLSENLIEIQNKTPSQNKQNYDEIRQTETQNDQELQLLSKKQQSNSDKKENIFEKQQQNELNNNLQTENKILSNLDTKKESSIKLKSQNSVNEEDQNKLEAGKSKQLIQMNDNKQSFHNVVTTQKNLTNEQLNENESINNEHLSPKNKELHNINSKNSSVQYDSVKSKKIITEEQIEKQTSVLNEKQLKLQIKQEKQLKEKQEKAEKEEQQKIKDEQAKQKLQQFLDKEKPILGIFAFHQFLSLFYVYYEKQSRLLRLAIYYNKLIWLLTLNSIFGKNISVVQVIVLSIVTTIVLTIVTTIIQMLLSKQKLVKIGLVIIFLFCLFCYYSILVVIAGQSAEDANMWILSYLATFILNEFIIGLLISIGMYYGCKKLITKVSNTVLELLGAALLLQTFKS